MSKIDPEGLLWLGWPNTKPQSEFDVGGRETNYLTF